MWFKIIKREQKDIEVSASMSCDFEKFISYLHHMERILSSAVRALFRDWMLLFYIKGGELHLRHGVRDLP